MPFPPDIIDEPHNTLTGDKMMGDPTTATGVMRRIIGMRIGLQRTAKGVSRAELAEAIGSHPESIEKWEAGGAAPSAFRLLLVADRLGGYAEWFLQSPQSTELRTVHSQLPPSGMAKVREKFDILRAMVRSQRDRLPEAAIRQRYKHIQRFRDGLLVLPDESQVTMPLSTEPVSDAGRTTDPFFEQFRLRPMPPRTTSPEEVEGTAPDRLEDAVDPAPDLSPPSEVESTEEQPVASPMPTCLEGPTLGKRGTTTKAGIAVKRVMGLRMFRVRRLIGMSRQQVASYLAVKRRTVGAWEGGSTPPSAIKMACLADLAGVDPMEMVQPPTVHEMVVIGAPTLSEQVVDHELQAWREDMVRQLQETPMSEDRARLRQLRASRTGVAHDPTRPRPRRQRARGRESTAGGTVVTEPPVSSPAPSQATRTTERDSEQEALLARLRSDLAAVTRRAVEAEAREQAIRGQLVAEQQRNARLYAVMTTVLEEFKVGVQSSQGDRT